MRGQITRHNLELALDSLDDRRRCEERQMQVCLGSTLGNARDEHEERFDVACSDDQQVVWERPDIRAPQMLGTWKTTCFGGLILPRLHLSKSSPQAQVRGDGSRAPSIARD
jgi:hypothetical protein